MKSKAPPPPPPEAAGAVTIGAFAVPDKAMVVGLPLALCAIDTDALFAPALVGAKVTFTVHEAATATLLQLLVWVN